MPQRPAALGVQPWVKVRVGVIQQLGGLKTVKPQEPVRLVQAMLPQQRRFSVQGRQQAIFHHRYIRGVEHALQPVLAIQ